MSFLSLPASLSSVLVRRAWRWLAVLIGLGAAAFATAAALMYFWVLPNIADHPDTVARLMSRALGQPVTLESVSGAWQQARPEFRLRGVRLYDGQGRTALHLPELEAAFAWRSLLFLEPRFNRIELQGLAFDAKRGRDGHLYVGGVPINPADPGGGFSSWLLRQGRVHVARATLNWQDEQRDTSRLTLNDVDLTLTNVRSMHRLDLHAVPPPTLARPLSLQARWRSRDTDDVATWDGHVDASSAGVSFRDFANWLDVPYLPQRGWGALQVRMAIEGGAVSGLSAGLDLREIETALGAQLPPLRLGRVRGQALWQREAGGQRVAFENVRVARPGGTLGEPFNIGLSWGADGHEVNARSLTLSGWQSLLPSLPMDPALRERLQALQPQGRFDTLRFAWRGAEPALDNFTVSARFRGLGVSAIGQQPGLANLSGRIEGDASAGEFDIDSSALGLSLPELFREPSFDFDTLQARGTWKKTARGRRIHFAQAVFANSDLAGSATGTFELVKGERGHADLAVHLTRAEGTAVYRYFPKKIGDRTVHWVQRGVLAGRSDDVQLTLKGNLAHFPFTQGRGVFRVEARVKDGVVDYVPGWPRIDGIEARLLFEGKRMEVNASSARIYGVALLPVKVEIPDLVHHDEVLRVDGVAAGPVPDFIRFANSSPVADRLRGFTEGLQGSGSMKLALSLQVPLRRSDDTTVAGRLSFLGSTLAPPNLPPLDQLTGAIDFTGHSVNARAITARFMGGPLRLDASTLQGQVQILAQGRATAAGMTSWLGAAWQRTLSGQAAWRGRFDLERGKDRIRIESDLVGLGSALPAPLAKSPAQPLPLLVAVQPRDGEQLHEVRLGRTASATWLSRAGAFARGEVRFGAPAVMPQESGLRLAGSASGLDISGWLALLPQREDGEGEPSLPLSAVDLGFDAFELMGRRFEDVRLQGRARGGLLRTQVTGRALNGVLTYRAPSGAQPGRVSGQFKQLTIPAPVSAPGGSAGANMSAADFPVLDLVVDDFRLQEKAMGRLDVLAHGGPQGLAIETLQLTHPDSVFRMNGLWRDSGLGETRADLNLQVLDAGRFLARFGYPDTLRRGTADIRGNATWEGSPADFAFATLAGQLDFKAKGGQFLRVEPGAAKLLGVLSLQSLPRRLNFDFRDIFNQGYAFDDIGATLRIARGVVYSDDLRMRGPAAKVQMSGLADLNQETVQLRVKVVPKLSEGVAVAGALLGGPIAGVGALAAQKLLRDPFEEVISQEYMVTGPWQAPDVKRLSKSKAKAEAALPEP